MTDEAPIDRRPISDRLRAAANGESYQLHWLVEAADLLDKHRLALMLIREGAADPSGFARRILAETSAVNRDKRASRRHDAS